MRLRGLMLCLMPLLATPLWAGELLPPDRAIDEVVDHYLQARLEEQGITPAAQAGDGNLIRRLTLDLVGRIPTLAETKAYVSSDDPQKRTALVDRLIGTGGFARYQAYLLDAMLMEGTRGSLRGYLLPAVAENRPWDQMFRALWLSRPERNCRRVPTSSSSHAWRTWTSWPTT
jgi:hypothetical protein